MHLQIRRGGVKNTEEVRNYLRKRLHVALHRFARHIDLVRVYLRDVNGPRGGPGMRCRMVVELHPRGRLIVAGTDCTTSGAIAAAASRVRLGVKRHVKRRLVRRRPPRRAFHQWPRPEEPAQTAPTFVTEWQLPDMKQPKP